MLHRLRSASLTALVLSLVCLIALVRASSAQTTVNDFYSYTGDTTGQPVWNRPNANGSNAPNTLSGTATATPYSAFNFRVAATGKYNFLSTTTTWDNYTFLYTGGFDATQPLVNVTLGNDDFPDTRNSGFNTVSLTAGTNYYFVTTGYSNTSFGAFTNSITRVFESTTTGTTTGAPTWNRPVANGSSAPNTLSGSATATPYQAIAFTVTKAGAYSFLSTSTNPTGWDNYTFLYHDSFDPTNQFNNIIIGNDDLGGIGKSGFNNVTLTTGTTYYFVTTGFSNTDAGDYSLSISGLGFANFSAVPTPGALVSAGLGIIPLVGFLRRRQTRPTIA